MHNFHRKKSTRQESDEDEWKYRVDRRLSVCLFYERDNSRSFLQLEFDEISKVGRRGPEKSLLDFGS